MGLQGQGRGKGGASSLPTFDPVSVLSNPSLGESRTNLCQHWELLPGKGLPRPETGTAFSATPADCARQRPRCPASAAAKPRKVKDYSDSRTKAALRGTA